MRSKKREDPKSARKSLRSTRYLREKKKRGSKIHTRDCERDSRAFKERICHAYCFNFDLEIVQSFQEIFNQRSSSSQVFIQAFIHLEKIPKGFLHLSKIFIVIFAHLRSCYCINLCSKLSYSCK